MTSKSVLEVYFSRFREHITGHHLVFRSPYGEKHLLYADWTASGRAYQPIEDLIQRSVLPYIANTHTGATFTGTLMSKAYEEAKTIIKNHVGANNSDALIFCGSGTTAAVNKLQRILGLRIPERATGYFNEGKLNDRYHSPDETLTPIVFTTRMEHHSNHISWLETVATVELIDLDENGLIDLDHFQDLLKKYRHRKIKIAAVTACSNVTGIQTPYREIAKMIHQEKGLCFADFACSAPYVEMDMHPAEQGAHLDAIYFSPHKFLGGPGAPGVLIFNKDLYNNQVPDQPGGGTVSYTNPWQYHEYVKDIEQREDGGTPPILQAIKAAMCIKLKEEMGVANIMRREKELIQLIFKRFEQIKNITVLQGNIQNRLGVVSFIVDGAHYNLIVKLLNDKFGIQTRGGCSCAGTYGHYLLNVDQPRSLKILNAIRAGDMYSKPGWIRLSIHPTMSNAEVNFMMDAIAQTALYFNEWADAYQYCPVLNEFIFKGGETGDDDRVKEWFDAIIMAGPAAHAELFRHSYPMTAPSLRDTSFK